MKIIGGLYKGRNFYRPAGIRPTQDVTREALFDILGQDMEGVFFLDLFAGSGAVGMEALSRGAQKVLFVEKDSKCVAVIQENIGLLAMERGRESGVPYEILQADSFAAVKLLVRQNKQFDIVFIDPPYSRGLAKKALKTLEAYDILHPNSLVVVQHETKEILPEHEGRFLLFRQKTYGKSALSIYKVKTNTKP